MASNDVKIVIVGDASKATKAFQQTEQQLGKFGQKAQAIGDKMTSVGRSMSLGLTLPLVAFGTAAFAAAADLGEAMSKVDTVFGDSADKVKTFASEALDSLGIAESTALDYTGTLGGMLKSMGFAEDAAADLSIEFVTMARDLASFNNMSPEEGFVALRSAITGEFEPLKRFGIILNETTIKQGALESGLWDGKGAIDAQTKALVIQSEIQKQASDAMGDYERTSDSAANQAAKAKESVKELAASFGEALLPVITPVLEFMSKLATTFADLPGPVKNALATIGLVAAALGPIIWIGGKVITTITNIVTTVRNVSGAFSTFIENAGGMRGALARVQDGAGGLVGKFRGAGVAIGGFTAILGLAAIAWQQNISNNREAEARLRSYTDALREANGVIDENVEKSILQELSNEGVLEGLNDAGIALDDFTNAMNNQTDATFTLMEAKQGYAKSEEYLLHQLRETDDATNNLIATAIEKGDLDRDEALRLFDLVERHRLAKQAIDEETQATGENKNAKGELIDENGNVIESEGEITNTLADTIDAWQTAKSELSGYLTKLREYHGETRSRIDQEAAYQEAIDKVSDSLTNNSVTFDLNTQKGRDNWAAVSDLTDEIWNNADANLANGDTLDTARTKTLAQAEAFRRQMIDAGLTKDEVNRLMRQQGLLPGQIQTIYSSPGLAEGARTVRETKNDINSLDGRTVTTQWNVRVSEVLGGVSDAVLRKLGIRAVGGPVMRNMPYLVGENGPELFTPSTAGTITANNRLDDMGSGGGGTPVIVNVQGSVITERELGKYIRDVLHRDGKRNGSTGLF